MRIFGLELSSKKRRAIKRQRQLDAEVEAAERAETERQLSLERQSQAFQHDAVKTPSAKTIAIARIPLVKNPALSFKERRANIFEPPEYDLAEIGRVEDVEPFVRRAFRYKEGLMFKEGWELVGPDKKVIRYIKERFRQIDQATGTSHKLLIRGIAADLVRFYNAFVVKVRSTRASGGRVRKLPGKNRTIQPVAGYFHIPPTTVQIKRDESGRVKAYRQMNPDGHYKDFQPEDVIHFFFDRKKGFMVGTPSLVPVLDDIRALRRIEENIEMLIYQTLFPLFHYKVGTEKAPAGQLPDGTDEIQAAQAKIESLPAEGALVTSERHEIKAIGSEGRALRAEGYLKHFKQRVFAGLGVSEVDMGIGSTANRSTSETMSRNMVDDVKSMQREFEIFINEFMIKELLLESTFPDPLGDDHRVELKFREIDLDMQIKTENHAVNSFQGHAITHTELRRAFGREPFSENDEMDSYWVRREEPRMLIQSVDESFLNLMAVRNPSTDLQAADLKAVLAQKQKELGSTQGTTVTKGKPGPQVTKTSSGQRAAAGKDQPSNQYGKQLAPTKKKSAFLGATYGRLKLEDMTLRDMVAKGNYLTAAYDDLLDNSLRAISFRYYNNTWFESMARAAGTLMKNRLLSSARSSLLRGFREATAGSLRYSPDSRYFDIFERRVAAVIDRYINRIIRRVEADLRVNEIVDLAERKRIIRNSLDALRFRSRFIWNSEHNKALNYGLALGYQALGHKEVSVIKDRDACHICANRPVVIPLDHVILDELPGYHPNCTCRIAAP